MTFCPHLLPTHFAPRVKFHRLLHHSGNILIYRSLEIYSSHLLHLLRHLVRVQHARHSDRYLSLLLLSSLQRLLALLEEKVGVVLARELPNLHEEVPQVLLERRDVLVEVEKSSHSYLDLREKRK